MTIPRDTSMCVRGAFQNKSSVTNAIPQMEWLNGTSGYQVAFPSHQRRFDSLFQLRRMGNIASIWTRLLRSISPWSAGSGTSSDGVRHPSFTCNKKEIYGDILVFLWSENKGRESFRLGVCSCRSSGRRVRRRTYSLLFFISSLPIGDGEDGSLACDLR